jgi:hypothetical protein
MVTDPTPLANILPRALDYLEERRAWWIAAGSCDHLPPTLAAMEAELKQPRLDWRSYGNWRVSLRLACHLARVRRQPTLLLCRYNMEAAVMGILADSSGIKHFQLILGLIHAEELAAARLAARALGGLPLQLAHISAGISWLGTGGSLFQTMVLDHPMTHQLEHELVRKSTMVGFSIYSPRNTTRL